jgi:bifunctional non-homologous end joining protein LigD
VATPQTHLNWSGAAYLLVHPALRTDLAHPPTQGRGLVLRSQIDGYRLQAHKAASTLTLYTRKGHDWTDRFLHLAAALTSLTWDSAIIDAELVHPEGFDVLKA